MQSTFASILEDRNADGYREVLQYCLHELAMPYQEYDDTNPYTLRFKHEFLKRKNILLPLIQKAIYDAGAHDDKELLEIIFQELVNVGLEDEIYSVLGTEQVDGTTRRSFVIAAINIFGFIEIVDELAHRIKSEDSSHSLREQLIQIYQEIQADEARDIAAELSEVYDRIDFSHYKLNDDEVTRNDTNRIEAEVAELILHEGQKSPKSTTILDLGAGTGRHTHELAERGYTKIVAVDYQQKHVDMIHTHTPNVLAFQADWSKIREIFDDPSLQDELKSYFQKELDRILFEFVFSLGRSPTHNRTPEEALHFFDEVNSMLLDRGEFLFDMEANEWEERQAKIARLREHHKNLGIRPSISNIIFDGPDKDNKYNRMILNQTQVQALCSLLGMRLKKSEIQSQHEGNVVNQYYLTQKDSSIRLDLLTTQQVRMHLRELGLLEKGRNLNLYIEAWGMTIAEALVWTDDFGLNNPHMRYIHTQIAKKMRIPNNPNIQQGKDGRLIVTFDSFNKTDYILAIYCKGKTQDEYEEVMKEYRSRKLTMDMIRDEINQRGISINIF